MIYIFISVYLRIDRLLSSKGIGYEILFEFV